MRPLMIAPMPMPRDRLRGLVRPRRRSLSLLRRAITAMPAMMLSGRLMIIRIVTIDSRTGRRRRTYVVRHVTSLGIRARTYRPAMSRRRGSTGRQRRGDGRPVRSHLQCLPVGDDQDGRRRAASARRSARALPMAPPRPPGTTTRSDGPADDVIHRRRTDRRERAADRGRCAGLRRGRARTTTTPGRPERTSRTTTATAARTAERGRLAWSVSQRQDTTPLRRTRRRRADEGDGYVDAAHELVGEPARLEMAPGSRMRIRELS